MMSTSKDDLIIPCNLRVSGTNNFSQPKFKSGQVVVSGYNQQALHSSKVSCKVSPKLGRPTTHKLSGNIKSFTDGSSEKCTRIMVTLKDGNTIHVTDAIPTKINQFRHILTYLKNPLAHSPSRSPFNQTGKRFSSQTFANHSTPSNKASFSKNSSFSPTPTKNNSQFFNEMHSLKHITSQNNKYSRLDYQPKLDGKNPSESDSDIFSFSPLEEIGAKCSSDEKENTKMLISPPRKHPASPSFDRVEGGSTPKRKSSFGTPLLSNYMEQQNQMTENKKKRTATPSIIGSQMQPKNFYSNINNTIESIPRRLMAEPKLRNFSPRRELQPIQNTTSPPPKPHRTFSAFTINRSPRSNRPALQGFSNLGNTCYINAILQALLGMDCFSHDLATSPIIKCLDTSTLYWHLCKLLSVKRFKGREEEKRKLLDTSLQGVKMVISKTAVRFSGYSQHDAHEFMMQCLSQLKDDVAQSKKNCLHPPTSPAKSNGGSTAVDQQGSEVMDTCTYDPITTNFEFVVHDSLKCNSCGAVVNHTQNSYDLPLRLPLLPREDGKVKSIQDALDAYFRPEVVDYTCAQCKAKASTLSHSFVKLPRVLVIHLKRYNYSDAGTNQKVSQRVSLPKYLTLDLHCDQQTSPCWPLNKRTWSKKSMGERSVITLPDSPNGKSLTTEMPKEIGDQPCQGSVSDEADRVDFTGMAMTEEEQLAKAIELSRASAQGQDRSLQEEEEEFSKVLELSKSDAFWQPVEPAADPDPQTTGDTVGTAPSPGDAGLEASQPSSSTLVRPAASSDDEAGENGCRPNGANVGEEESSQSANKDTSQLDSNVPEAENGDLKKATNLSRQESDSGIGDTSVEPEISFAYTAEELKLIKQNEEEGGMPYSYQLMGIVNHIGSSSDVGHYISDVYSHREKAWFSYDDSEVNRTSEESVRQSRQKTGYIFFYVSKDITQELS